jgi:hypothetical protein
MTVQELTQNSISNWGTIECGVPQGSILWLFLLYINDLPKITNSENLKINLKTNLFVDDTSVIISNHNVTDLEQNINWVFKKINECFNTNLFSPNFSRTYFMQLQSKNIPTTAININYNNKTISNNTHFKVSLMTNCQNNVLEKSYWNNYSQTESSLFYN